jgi:hypothetical protein
VTSPIDWLDKVVDDLSAKIKNDEGGVEEALNKIVPPLPRSNLCANASRGTKWCANRTVTKRLDA